MIPFEFCAKPDICKLEPSGFYVSEVIVLIQYQCDRQTDGQTAGHLCCSNTSVCIHVIALVKSSRYLPAYIKVVILLRSSGGAHIDSIDIIDPCITPYTYTVAKLKSHCHGSCPSVCTLRYRRVLAIQGQPR